MCFTDVREMYTEENSTCLSGVTDQPDCPVRTSQPSASQTCAGSLPRQLCRHWGPFSPQLPPLDLRLHRGPSRGCQPALRHRSSSTLELPAHTGAKRQHVTPGCSPEGRPWQGPSLGLHPHSRPAHGKYQCVDQKPFLGLSSPPGGWGWGQNCRRRPVLRHKDHGKPGHMSCEQPPLYLDPRPGGEEPTLFFPKAVIHGPHKE